MVSVHEGLKENPIESAEVAVKLRDAEAASTKHSGADRASRHGPMTRWTPKSR